MHLWKIFQIFSAKAKQLVVAVAIDSCFELLVPPGADNQVSIWHLFFLNILMDMMFSCESRFCLWHLDHRFKVWQRYEECFGDCLTNKVTYFGGGSVMVWDGISLTGKTRLVVIEGNFNAERYQEEILQPVVVPWLHNLGPHSILQDENADSTNRVGLIRDDLQKLGVGRMDCQQSSPQPHWTLVGSAWAYCLCQSDQCNHGDLQPLLVNNEMPYHSSVWSGWWPAMLRRCQAPVC